MAPKPRSSKNKGYPKRWRWKKGAWRYRVPEGMEHLWDGKTEFRLGATDAEAYKVWADRLQLQREARTLGELLDRYEQQVVPTKAPKTRESNRISLRRLRAVFGHMDIPDLRPVHAYQYVDHMADRPTSARRDVEVLRHAYTMAVRWGLVDRNPLMGTIRLEGRPPRDRDVEDWEIAEALAVAPPLLALYIPLKIKTGLRRGDILRLRLPDLKKDGIHVGMLSKTKKTTRVKLIVEWDNELSELVEAIKRLPPRRIGNAPLFVTRKGKAYITQDGSANAFDSLWQRFMAKALEETKLTIRFQERDLRAKTATDSDTVEEASERLGHSSTEITQKVYRRKPRRVKPLLLGRKPRQ